MMWFKKHWKKFLLLLIAVGLVGLFLWGESMQSYDQRAEQTAAPQHTELPVSEESKQPEAPASSEMPDGGTPAPTGTDGADPVLPEETPMQTVPQGTEQEENAYTCTISISCAVLLEHMEELSPEKAELVPEDGWILTPTEVTFYEGESVFQVLRRICKQQEIHMEFENTPIYQSAYIEGIHNLYEFDCGELSGWMYRVNGWFPNYGCGRYLLQPGDVVEWLYTCDLGADIGGNNAVDEAYAA